MDDQRKILYTIIKYGAICACGIFLVRTAIRIPLEKEIFNASGIRIFLMFGSFGTVFLFRKRISFNSLALFTILIVYLGLILYPLYGTAINIGGILMMLITTIMASAIPFAIYHPKSQIKIILLINTLVLLSCLVVLTQLKSFLAPESYQSVMNLISNELMLGFAFVGSYLAVNWIIYQYQVSNYETKEKIELVNQQIEENIVEIEKQNVLLGEKQMDLRANQKKLIEINQGLAQEVSMKTSKVEEQIQLFLKLSFINSHYLRAPVSRIKSVLEVWEYLENKERESIIKESTTELKLVIDGILEINEQKMEPDKLEDYLKKTLADSGPKFK